MERSEGAAWDCPECGEGLKVYDHSEERRWRHLDTCQYQTHLHARIPRVQCPRHGVLQVKVAWAEPKSRFTMRFERLAIDVLRECDVTGATRILGIRWDEAWGVMERAVEYVGEDRKQESLEAYYEGLSPKQREGIEAVAMDMWEPYVAATRKHLAGADEKIVFDRFHIMSYLSKGVDAVRKEEHRQRMQRGDEALKGTRYLWLYSKENVPGFRRREFASLRRLELKVGRAWAIKETLRELWHYVYPEAGRRFWKRWYFWVTHSRLKPLLDAAGTLKRHLANMLTYFRHRITNAVSEWLNSKIQTIKKMAYGFRNPEHFKTAICFHCGKLDLYPC